MSTPHDRAQTYLFAAVRGQETNYESVRGDASCICGPQSGSGNWPIQIAAGAEIAGDREGQDLKPFLTGGNGCPDATCEHTGGLLRHAKWGLNGTEHGSSIYESWNMASVLALINKAERYRGPGPRRNEALRWIRAQIAKYCLSMPRQRPERSVLYVEAEGAFDPRDDGIAVHSPDGWSYPTDSLFGSSPYPVMVGSRQLERFNRSETRAQENPVNLDRNMMGPIIAWALGRLRAFPRNQLSSWGWPILLLEEAFGTTFDSDTPPAKFGLRQDDVDIFVDFLNHRQSPRSLVDRYLAGYGTTRDQECHWIQLRDGRVASWINETIHTSTTGCVLAWTEGETVHWVSPDSTSRGSAGKPSKAYCRRVGDVFIATAEDPPEQHRLRRSPVRREFEPFTRQEQLWEVVWDARGFRIVGEDAEPVARHPEHDQTIAGIGTLIPRYPTSQVDRELLATCGELVNRQGGRSGQQEIAPWQRQRLVVEAAEKVLHLAQDLPGVEPIPRHEPQHPDTIASVGRLMQRYGAGSTDRDLLAAYGELINRQGGRRGGSHLSGHERRAAVVEAAEAVLAESRRL